MVYNRVSRTFTMPMISFETYRRVNAFKAKVRRRKRTWWVKPGYAEEGLSCTSDLGPLVVYTGSAGV